MEKNEIITLILMIVSCVAMVFAIINLSLIITLPQEFMYAKDFIYAYMMLIIIGAGWEKW